MTRDSSCEMDKWKRLTLKCHVNAIDKFNQTRLHDHKTKTKSETMIIKRKVVKWLAWINTCKKMFSFSLALAWIKMRLIMIWCNPNLLVSASSLALATYYGILNMIKREGWITKLWHTEMQVLMNLQRKTWKIKNLINLHFFNVFINFDELNLISEKSNKLTSKIKQNLSNTFWCFRLSTSLCSWKRLHLR